MSIDGMNKKIEKLDIEIESLVKKRKQLVEERDMALAAETQKIFTKLKIPPEKMMLLKYANDRQLKTLLSEIENGIGRERINDDNRKTKE